ncbi:cupredoxin family copper-binding protein [Nitrospirillum sp. BR 11164]|uniref:cupredoxin domain-containing protein n=1 Tax=Nitrospirillum sp. BR 11164 TaxID=3104324 RepID=UPI002AFDD4A7|nr:cupredoxin family copper-binding protein [Nitrospirillum sp. BR 11164]MEA1652469.1 cupredoxin family copper-binding protein [Nitrospirillum sp. BR 11164]
MRSFIHAARIAAVLFCALTGLAQAETVEIRIDNFTFSPAEVHVAPGTTIVWVNADDIPHAVAANDKSFRSKVLDTEEKYSRTVAGPGTIDYFCSLHPHMTGRIIVDAGGSQGSGTSGPAGH